MPRPYTPKAWCVPGILAMMSSAATPPGCADCSPKGHWGGPDAAIAAAYLELLANARKVGCCWGGYIAFAMGHPSAHELRAFAGVQEHEQVYAAQLMGFPLLAPALQAAAQGAGCDMAVIQLVC